MQSPTPGPSAAAAIPPASTPVRSPDALFKSLTDSGNAAFAAGDDRHAEAFYRAALDEAEALLARAAGNDGTAILLAPMALNIAFQNLAAMKARARAVAEARSLAIRPVARLIEIAASPAQPLALRLNCVRHLRHGFSALTGFVDRDQGVDDEIEAIGERASAVAEAVIRTAALMRAAERSDRASPARANHS